MTIKRKKGGSQTAGVGTAVYITFDNTADRIEFQTGSAKVSDVRCLAQQLDSLAFFLVAQVNTGGLGVLTSVGETIPDMVAGFIQVTAQDTINPVLENITGCSFSLVLPWQGTARINAVMTGQCSTTGGGAGATGAWAIRIHTTDGLEIERAMSGVSDKGSFSAGASLGGLPPATYVVQGLHRRVAGAIQVDTDVAQLQAYAVRN